MNESRPVFVLGSYVAAISMKTARLPVPGESIRGDAVWLEAGGKGLNVAIAARRLGSEVDGLVAIGTDRFADMAIEAFAAADLPAAMLLRFPGSSGTGVGLIDAGGENMIAVCPGANSLLSEREVAGVEYRIAGSAAVVAQFEIEDAPIAAAFSLARKHGVRTILNPSPYRTVSPDILDMTDIMVVNATEAAALLKDITGGEATSFGPLAVGLAERGVTTLVVTLGADGASLLEKGTCLHQPAFVVDAVDATGCGDAFLAALVVDVAKGSAWPDTLRRAVACGALTCARGGVLDALPTRDDLAELTGFTFE